MTLDEVTLSNLEVLVNNHDRSERGSLWAFVNKCRTAFGRQELGLILATALALNNWSSGCNRRLLRSWLCRPLFRARDIRQRASAVEELVELLPEEAQKAREVLKGNNFHHPSLCVRFVNSYTHNIITWI
jgi:DNA mismatch repair ATPase MutS